MPENLPENTERIELITGRVHLSDRPGQRTYEVTILESGENKNGWTMPPEVLGAAINKFAGAPCQLDHRGWFEGAKLEKLAGTIQDPSFQDSSAIGTLAIAPTPAGNLVQRIFDAWIEDKAAGREVAEIGLSAVLWLRWKPREEWEDPLVCSEIVMVESVDAVLHPAAGGAVERVLNSQGPRPQAKRSNIMPKEVREQTSNEVEETSTDAPETSEGASNGNQAPNPAPEANPELLDQFADVASHIESLTAQVDRLTAFIADQEADRTVVGMGQAPQNQMNLRMGRTGIEQIELAFDALMEGVHPPEGVQPLTGIRELYMLLSGDYELTGRFHADRVNLATVNSSTMAAMVANRLNKVVVNTFQTYPKWWAPIVEEMDFATLQDARWITLGGVGELPTVSEGAAYTELTWDDNTETAAFVKKGGYLGITIEAIDKDDTRRLRMAPQALAQAAWLTLSKSISAIFTAQSGIGPDLADGTELFATSRGNLGTTALSHAEWQTVRQAMRDQTELNSGEALGALTAPKYLLVPNELELTALQILATEHTPGSADYNNNPFADGNERMTRLQSARERVIVIDLWTDANDWAAVADPNMYPSLAIGYRYGRTPEIFSVASPTAGLMFSNDVMPVKVRFFYATGPVDYRGTYKQIVA